MLFMLCYVMFTLELHFRYHAFQVQVSNKVQIMQDFNFLDKTWKFRNFQTPKATQIWGRYVLDQVWNIFELFLFNKGRLVTESVEIDK